MDNFDKEDNPYDSELTELLKEIDQALSQHSYEIINKNSLSQTTVN